MSSMTAPTYPYLHYVSGIVPFLVAATVVGIGRLAPRARLRAVVVVLFLTVTTTLAAGPWPGGIGWTPSWYWGGEVSDERVETLERALVLVPDDASIAATNRVGSHLAARRYLYSLPRIGRAEWIVLDADDVWIPQPIGGDADPKVVRTFRERIERSPEWVKVFEEQSILVFRKVGA
jgi:hypothetical protein